jgi:hypothetical protein
LEKKNVEPNFIFENMGEIVPERLNNHDDEAKNNYNLNVGRALEALRIDSEILNSTLDYNLLVQYVLDLAVRWSTWPAAVLLIGEEQTPLTSVTFFDNQWQLSVRGMEFAHRALSGRVLLTSHGEMFTHAQHVIHTAMAIPMSWCRMI